MASTRLSKLLKVLEIFYKGLILKKKLIYCFKLLFFLSYTFTI